MLPTGNGKSLCYAMLPIVFNQLFATTKTTTDISRSGHICVCRPRGKRLIMIFITNSVNCATKTAASCNIPRAQLDDAKQTGPLSVYVRGVATPDYIDKNAIDSSVQSQQLLLIT